MDEEHLVDFDHGVLCLQPLSVLSRPAERDPVLEPTEWVLLFPLPAVRPVLFLFSGGLGVEGLLPQFRRIRRTESLELPLRYVSEVPYEIHAFVVPEEDMDPTTRPRGLLLETHEQVHDFARIGASVQDVAGLDKMGRPAGPGVAPVDQTRGSQDSHELVEVAVNIPDGNDTIHAVERILSLRGES